MPVPSVVGAPGEVPDPDPVGDLGEVVVHPRGRPAEPEESGGPVVRQVTQPHLAGPVPPLRPGAEQDELVLRTVRRRGRRAPGQGHPDARDEDAGVLPGPLRGRCRAVRPPEHPEDPVGRQRAVVPPGAHRCQREAAAHPDHHRDARRAQPAQQPGDREFPRVQDHGTRRPLPAGGHLQERVHHAVGQGPALGVGGWGHHRDRGHRRTLGNRFLIVRRRSGQVQPPVDRSAQVRGDRPDAHRLLGVEHLTEGGHEAPAHSHTVLARLRYQHGAHHPGVRRGEPVQVPAQLLPYRRPVPGGAAHEVVQALLGGGAVDQGRDVADRLAAPRPQEALDVLDPPAALVAAGQRGEQGRGQVVQHELVGIPRCGRPVRLTRHGRGAAVHEGPQGVVTDASSALLSDQCGTLGGDFAPGPGVPDHALTVAHGARSLTTPSPAPAPAPKTRATPPRTGGSPTTPRPFLPIPPGHARPARFRHAGAD